MKKIIILLSLAIVLNIFCVPQEERTLVRINGETIKVKDFLQKWRPRKFASEEEEKKAKLKALEPLIERKLIIAEAKKRGLDKDPKIIEDYEKGKKRILINAVYRIEVKERIRVSEPELRRQYALRSKDAHVYLILTDSFKTAQYIYRKLKDGIPFESLAVKYSKHPSSTKGGDIGFINYGSMDKITYRAISGLKPGGYSKPVKLPNGNYVLFKIQEIRKRKQKPFKEIKERLKKELKMKKERELAKEVYDRIIKEADIRYNEEGLNILLKPKDSLTVKDMEVWVAKKAGGKIVKVKNLLDIYRVVPPYLPKELRKNAIKQEIERDVLYDYALRKKIEKEKQTKETLEKLKENILYDNLYKEEVTEKISFTEEDLKRYFEENYEKYVTPERRRLRIIEVETQEKAREVKKLLKTKDFGELAKKYSIDVSSKRGGNIGLVKKDKRRYKEFVKVGFSLKKGEVSSIFKTKRGYGLVKCEEIIPEKRPKFEEVKQRVTWNLKKELLDKRYKEFITTLKKIYKIEINEALLEKIGKKEVKRE